MSADDSRRPCPPSPGRVGLLALVVGLGWTVGLIGSAATGKDEWYLAIPLFLAVAWFWVADPGACRARPCAARADRGAEAMNAAAQRPEGGVFPVPESTSRGDGKVVP